MKNTVRCLLVAALLANAIPTTARADVIRDWNQNMLNAALVPPATSPLVMSRVAAIVESAVFDAVNGIERRYTPIHVEPAAPRGASRRAAAVQAAYATLVKLYPAQQSTLDARRTDSLAEIAATENSQSIARGIQWGQTVADGILAWRGTDGLTPPPPPFLGSLDVGKWRPTPPAFLPGAGPQFATMTPWAINSPSQFRPAGPPALTSAQYTADFNETKTMGSFSSVSRTSDQTLYSLFWNAGTVSSFWDRIALSLAEEHHFNFLRKARLLALLNISMADALIGCWDAKYNTAIREYHVRCVWLHLQPSVSGRIKVSTPQFQLYGRQEWRKGGRGADRNGEFHCGILDQPHPPITHEGLAEPRSAFVLYGAGR